MCTILVCGILVCFSFLTMAASRNQPDTTQADSTTIRPQQGDLYAVIIGIGQSQDGRIPPRRFGVNDALGLYDVLTDPRYGGVPKDHITLLLDQEATQRNIKVAIGKWLTRQVRQHDTAIIYYAGQAAPEGADTYWMTYDAASDDLYSTALSSVDIVALRDRVGSKWLLTLVDSSYSAATVSSPSHSRKTQIISRMTGTIAISATDGRQGALELDAYQHGVFTYYLLEGLKGEADSAPRDGVIDVEEIWDYIKARVTKTARKHGHHQTPVFHGSLADRIPFTYNVEYLRRQQE